MEVWQQMSAVAELPPPFELLEHRSVERIHRFLLAVPAQAVDAIIEARLSELAPRARLPGFRPGKIPMHALRRQYGSELRAAAIQSAGLSCAARLFRELGLHPVATPGMSEETDPNSGNGEVLLRLEVETLPTIDTADLAEIRLLRPVVAGREAESELTALTELVLRTRLLDALDEQYRFPISQTAAKEETRGLLAGYRIEVGEEPDAETRRILEDIARRRIRLGMLLSEFGRRLHIDVPQEELRALVQEQAAENPDVAQALEAYYLSQPAALAQLRAPVFEQRVIAAILERCRIETVTVNERRLREMAQPDSSPS